MDQWQYIKVEMTRKLSIHYNFVTQISRTSYFIIKPKNGGKGVATRLLLFMFTLSTGNQAQS